MIFPQRMCVLFENEVTVSKVPLFQQKAKADHGFGLCFVFLFLFSFSFFPKLAANYILITSSLLKSPHASRGLEAGWPPPDLAQSFHFPLSRTERDRDPRRKDEKTQAATSKSQASGPVSVSPAFLGRGMGSFPVAARSCASLHEEQRPWLPPEMPAALLQGVTTRTRLQTNVPGQGDHPQQRTPELEVYLGPA